MQGSISIIEKYIYSIILVYMIDLPPLGIYTYIYTRVDHWAVYLFRRKGFTYKLQCCVGYVYVVYKAVFTQCGEVTVCRIT